MAENCPSVTDRRLTSWRSYKYLRHADPSHMTTVQPPTNFKTQRVLVALGDNCAVSFDEELENKCYHPVASATRECMVPDLPYLRFATYNTTEKKPEMGHYKLSYVASIRRAMPILQERFGWGHMIAVRVFTPQWWREMEKADVVVISQLDFSEVVGCFPDKRYILVLSNDAATLSQSVSCSFDDERIIGMLGHTMLNPIYENNGPLVENRRHFAWISDGETGYRTEKVTPAIASKIYTVIPQVFRWRFPLDCGGRRDFTLLSQAFQKPIELWLRPFDERPIDIAFVGVINSELGVRDTFGVNSHRAKAMASIEALQRKYPHLRVFRAGHRLTYAKYISLLRDTKIFVSPFGLGEFSGKDYEGMLAGSLVVKPYSDKLKSYPNIYNKRFALNVDVDFKGLEEVIMPYLNDPKLSWERAYRSLELLKKFSNPEVFAEDLDAVLSEVMQKTVTFNRTVCLQMPMMAYDEFGERRPLPVLRERIKEYLIDKYGPEKDTSKWYNDGVDSGGVGEEDSAMEEDDDEVGDSGEASGGTFIDDIDLMTARGGSYSQPSADGQEYEYDRDVNYDL